jgi:O-antigen/teichoic acid export membrane protein
MEPPELEDEGARGAAQVGHLAKQSALLLSSGAISYGGSFILHVVLARGLGKAGFGAWVVALALARTLSTLGLMGADWIILRQGSYYQGTGDIPRLRKTIYLAFILSGTVISVLTVSLFFAAPFVAEAAFEDKESITSLLRITALLLPVMAFGQIMLFGTQAFKSMREYSLIRNILQPFVRLAFCGVALLIATKSLSAFIGLAFAEVFLMLVAAYALNRKMPLFGPTDEIEQKNLIKFAMPVWGTKLVDIARGQLFLVLLGSLTAFGASAAFVASQRVAVAPSAIIAAFNQVYKPMGSDLYLQERHSELGTLFKSIGKWSFALGFPLFCYQILFPDDILAIFGADFVSAQPALMLLAVGMLFNFGTGPVATTLIMSGRAKVAFLDHILVVGLEIGLAFWLIPAHGLLGAAAARMIGTAFNNSLRLTQVWLFMKLHPYRWDYWKPILAGALSAGLAWLVVEAAGIPEGVMTALVAAGIIGVTYLGLILLFGLSVEDRAAIDPVLKRLRRGRKEKKEVGSAS